MIVSQLYSRILILKLTPQLKNTSAYLLSRKVLPMISLLNEYFRFRSLNPVLKKLDEKRQNMQKMIPQMFDELQVRNTSAKYKIFGTCILIVDVLGRRCEKY